MIPWIGPILFGGKALLAVKFIAYRMAVWSGAVWLFRRGQRNRRWIYYILSASVYVMSWIVVIFSAEKTVAWFWKVFGRG